MKNIVYENDEKLVPLSFNEFLNLYENLKIPPYQRPYKWSIKSAIKLFLDLKTVFNSNPDVKYRIGTIILNKNQEEYDIVDGQQRLTTIILIYKVFCLKGIEHDKRIDYLLDNLNFKKNSYISIIENMEALKEIVSDSKEENTDFFKYILDKCEIACISVTDLEVAFQLFDSQNSRGKTLEPHDILKAYHLRMWKPDIEKDKNKIEKYITFWNQKVDCIKKYVNLKSLFADYIFPITQWIRNKDGLYFDKDDIEIFKGISSKNNINNYGKFYSLIDNNIDIDNFVYLLNQDIIQGEFFFNYVIYYIESIETLKSELKELDDYKEYYKKLFTGVKGNKYTGKMWLCLLILLVDRFNMDVLSDKALVKKTFKWAVSIRLKNYSLSEETINKYALGKSSINNFNYFNYIVSIANKEKVLAVQLDDLKKEDLTRITKEKESNNVYSQLYDYCFGVNNE